MSSPRKRRGGVEAILGGADKRVEERKHADTVDPALTQKTKQKASYYLDQDVLVALEQIKITLRKAGLSPREASYSHIIETAIKAFHEQIDGSPVETISRFRNQHSG